MTIKNKLRLGFTFLFIIFVILGGIAVWYINQLSKASTAILKDNYETLQYTQQMLQNLGDYDEPMTEKQLRSFDKALKNQESNISEIGENESTTRIRESFDELQSGRVSGSDLAEDKQIIQDAVFKVIDLNMQAIVRKNDKAAETAHNATIFVALMATFCFLAAFSFIVNFPGYVANPIKELTEGIKEIAHKNYSRRIEIRSNDEFGRLATSFNQMAAKLNEYETSNLAKIQFEKLRIETIVRNLNDAVIGFDEKQTVLFSNPTALKLLGLKEENIVGKNATEVALKNDLLRNMLVGKETGELKIYADDKESFFNKEIYQIEIADDNLDVEEQTIARSRKNIGSVILLKNITKFHELDEAKTHFIATISHELKTPISAIKMSLKLLEDSRVGELNTEQKNLVENVRTDSERLLKITTELLDLAQVETGNIQINFTPTKAGDVVNYAADAIRTAAKEKHIQINVDLQPGLPDVQADQEKTAWVLVNFLSNAVRYSPERSSIDVQVKRAGKEVEFAVRDYGKGIDEKYRSRIFDRYFQVPTDMQSKGGTGLGLAISKDFIAAQSGRIWVESESGEGSKFCFALPAAG